MWDLIGSVPDHCLSFLLHVAAIFDFVTIGLVVVRCLVCSQLAPWSVRP